MFVIQLTSPREFNDVYLFLAFNRFIRCSINVGGSKISGSVVSACTRGVWATMYLLRAADTVRKRGRSRTCRWEMKGREKGCALTFDRIFARC